MKQRTFGNTGLSFSEVCFGTWRFADPGGNPDSRSEAGETALRNALDAGINCIHSSGEYGTRWLTGSVLKDHPQRANVHHIIKVNEPDFGDEGFSAARFRTKVEMALRELHTDRIAVVQHLQRGSAAKAGIYEGGDDPVRIAEFNRDREEMARAVHQLRRAGTVESFASFPYTVPFARHAIASGLYDGLVIYLNVLETEWLDLFPDMQRRGMGVIGIRPLCAGLLTDKRVDRTSLPADDRLAGPEWDAKYEQLSMLREHLSGDPASWSHYAVGMALAHPLVATTTLSINTPAQLEDALAAASGAYPSEEDLQRIHHLNRTFWEKRP